MPLYKYVGKTEALLSSHDLVVRPGDIIESETPIDNANFERLSDAEQPARRKPVAEAKVEE